MKEDKLKREVEEINNMKYDKSRQDRAEKIRAELQKVHIICGAIERATGRICSLEPAEGSTNGRCARHGGLSTGAVTEEGRKASLANLNPRANLVHGLYSRFAFTQEEADFYTGMMNYYIEALDLDPANIMILDRAVRNFLLNQRKEVAEENEMINGIQFDIDYDSKFLKHMQALGLDRKFQVTEKNKGDNAGQIGSGIAGLFMD